MARGRFISKTITTDREINALSSDTSRLAFTWLLTFADCEGRVTGEPDLLLASLFPRRQDITAPILQSFIQEWASAGFIVWYLAPDGDRYIQFLNFAKHQIGLRKDREGSNPIPAPENSTLLAGTLPDELHLSSGTTPDLLRSNSGVTPAEVKVKVKDKVNGEVKVNREEETAAAAEPFLKLYSEEISPLTPAITTQLRLAAQQYGQERLTCAITEASHHNVRSWKYIHAILTAPTTSPPASKTHTSQDPPTARPLTALEVVKAEMRRVGCDPAGIFKP